MNENIVNDLNTQVEELEQRIKTLEKPLSTSEAEVFAALLTQHDAMDLENLCEQLGLQRNHVSRALNGLEKRGWIRCRSDSYTVAKQWCRLGETLRQDD